jgi:cyclic pyranopterin phosphate synthase
MADLSHIDEKGNARMVDVSGKAPTVREAFASGRVHMRAETLKLISGGGIPKGDVFAAARIAGIMAAKRTFELIPMCHSIPLDSARVDFEYDFDNSCVIVKAVVGCTWKTGVEMEALTAVTTAALTIYDMCKAVDKEMEIGDIRLDKKTGGKSGDFERKWV